MLIGTTGSSRYGCRENEKREISEVVGSSQGCGKQFATTVRVNQELWTECPFEELRAWFPFREIEVSWQSSHS